MVYLGIPCHNGIGPQNPMGSPPLQHPFQATPIPKLCQRAQRQQQGLFGLASIARLWRTMNVEEMYFSYPQKMTWGGWGIIFSTITQHTCINI